MPTARPRRSSAPSRRPRCSGTFNGCGEYGIDGAFVQRFAAGARSPDFQRQNNTVLAHCRAGANLHGAPTR
ncbi:MAG: hypothetical protein WDN28_29335 [Chthoniobacter sp.]